MGPEIVQVPLEREPRNVVDRVAQGAYGRVRSDASVPEVLFTQIMPAVSRARSSRSPPSTK